MPVERTGDRECREQIAALLRRTHQGLDVEVTESIVAWHGGPGTSRAADLIADELGLTVSHPVAHRRSFTVHDGEHFVCTAARRLTQREQIIGLIRGGDDTDEAVTGLWATTGAATMRPDPAEAAAVTLVLEQMAAGAAADLVGDRALHRFIRETFGGTAALLGAADRLRAGPGWPHDPQPAPFPASPVRPGLDLRSLRQLDAAFEGLGVIIDEHPGQWISWTDGPTLGRVAAALAADGFPVDDTIGETRYPTLFVRLAPDGDPDVDGFFPAVRAPAGAARPARLTRAFRRIRPRTAALALLRGLGDDDHLETTELPADGLRPDTLTEAIAARLLIDQIAPDLTTFRFGYATTAAAAAQLGGIDLISRAADRIAAEITA